MGSCFWVSQNFLPPLYEKMDSFTNISQWYNEQLKENCQQWKSFKRQLEDLEHVVKHDHLGKWNNDLKSE